MSRLEEIRARWEKATPGPWHWQAGGWFIQDEDGRNNPICKVHTHGADAQAIAHAPEDIKRLLKIAEAAEELEDFFDPHVEQTFFDAAPIMNRLRAALSPNPDKEEG